MLLLLKPHPGSFLKFFVTGTRGNRMYFLSKGTARVTKKQDDGEYKTVSIITEGNGFGEIALVNSHAKRTATVTSMTYCEVYVLKKKDIDRVLQGNPIAQAEIKRKALEIWLGLLVRLCFFV